MTGKEANEPIKRANDAFSLALTTFYQAAGVSDGSKPVELIGDVVAKYTVLLKTINEWIAVVHAETNFF